MVILPSSVLKRGMLENPAFIVDVKPPLIEDLSLPRLMTGGYRYSPSHPSISWFRGKSTGNHGFFMVLPPKQ